MKQYLIRFFLAVVATVFTAASCAEVPVVAAASSTRFALEELAKNFETESNQKLRLVFGSSGNLYRQIVQGAPFDMFMSADESYIAKLEQAGKTSGESRLYAKGRVVLFVPRSSAFSVDGNATGLATALGNNRIKRFAIANPKHAPYGRAAKQAFESLNLWETIKPVLVLGESVSQAAQFAASGSAQGGIFAYSLALLPQIAEQGEYVLLSEALHRPINHRMVLTQGAGREAGDFFEYLQQPLAQKIYRRHGFSTIDE